MTMRVGPEKLVLVIWLALAGCAGSRPATSGRSTGENTSYSEDLTAVRPVYTPAPPAPVAKPTTPVTTPRKPETRKPGPAEALHVNRRLDMVMDTIATKNRSIRYAPGFRLQVYVGNQRQEADAAKLLIAQKFPELNPYLTYNQPTYRLKVGDFMRRLDAERYYASIRQFLPSAQLQPDKVDVRRSLLIK